MELIKRYMPQILILVGCILAAVIYLGATSSEAKAADEGTVVDVPGIEVNVTEPEAVDEEEEGFVSKFLRGYKAASTEEVEVLNRMAELDKREAELSSREQGLEVWEDQLDEKNYRIMADRGKLVSLSESLNTCVDQAMAKYNKAAMSAESAPPKEDEAHE